MNQMTVSLSNIPELLFHQNHSELRNCQKLRSSCCQFRCYHFILKKKKKAKNIIKLIHLKIAASSQKCNRKNPLIFRQPKTKCKE